MLLGASAIAHCFSSPHRTRHAAVCRAVKPVGKPDAGNPHVRFDERGRETERCRMAQATAPVLDSTMDRLLDDLWALFIDQIQRLAEQDAGSFRFQPLSPPRLGFTALCKLLVQLPNLARRAGCTARHLGNPG